MQEEASIYALSPSFSSYSSARFAEIAAKVSEEFHGQKEELGLEGPDFESVVEEEQTRISSISFADENEKDEEESSCNDEDGDDEFEFTILSRDVNASPISADQIFSEGQIKPIYPVFNRDLLFAGGQDEFFKLQETAGSSIRLPLRKLFGEERNPSSSTSSEADDLETLPDGTYCVWTPKSAVRSPEMAKKSNSTGSSKRWRFRDLLHRSNSDGKDTYVFLTPMAKKKEKKVENDEKIEVVDKPRRHSSAAAVPGEARDAGKGKPRRFSGEGSASPHEAHYVRNRAMKESDRKKSYLPYRQDLVGFFANVNGLNRTLRPF